MKCGPGNFYATPKGWVDAASYIRSGECVPPAFLTFFGPTHFTEAATLYTATTAKRFPKLAPNVVVCAANFFESPLFRTICMSFCVLLSK